ncbi:ATPase, T2SS/T4P/T4SS family [Halomonas kalidii]|uniref:ATPase, T2SS/T4P/T4SS family n=1 Tax=Halomonas kalidii TaxID=3043293 RepID=A0ABT6VNT0_9GAMM|nr:ATPase, T2SS/T4P/T4SS family [Halomonas kalidii]MDI5935164.1 ATPase, T2SS/T4P/T4SS family [Halomonas kalidii]
MSRRYSTLFTDDAPASSVDPARPYHLLFVDDDPGILSALRRVFHRENYALLFADSAEQALAILEENSVEVIISDFKMPGMDGNELLRIVRERWPQTLRIMLTGYANSEVVMGSMRDGAVYRFNLKPWNDDDLRLTVALALEQYEARRRKRTSSALSSPSPSAPPSLAEVSVAQRNQLPRFLHGRGLLNARQLQQLHKEMHASRAPAIRAIVDHGWVDAERVHALLRDEKLCEEIDLREVEIDPALFSITSLATCERQWVLPARLVDGRLDLAMADPLDRGLIEAIAVTTGHRIHPLLCEMDQLASKLKEVHDRHGWLQEVSEPAADEDPFEDIEILLDDRGGAEGLEAILDSSVDPPAVRLVNAILLEALNLEAREVYLQPRLESVAVRYRVLGLLQDTIQIPSSLLVAVVSRIKVMAELDVAEQLAPQQGHLAVKTPMHIVDLAVSTFPTPHGEQVAIKLSPRNRPIPALGALGLSEDNRQRLVHACARPQGMILVAGPPDSGKSTLLHALLKHETLAGGHHVTIEPPQRFSHDTARNSTDILDAAIAQGAEAILIDDQQDNEVLAKALRTAIADGKVLTAMRAISSADVFSRLLACRARPHEIASGLGAIVLQRLARKLCTHCREPVRLEESTTDREACHALGGPFTQPPPLVYRPQGCLHCRQGFQGRIGIHEVILVTDELRCAIASDPNPWALQSLAREAWNATLLADAHDKVTRGVITTSDVLRVIGPRQLD